MGRKSITVDKKDVDEVPNFKVYVKCPYCGFREFIDEDYAPPDEHECFKCDKKFGIKYTEIKTKK
jgi:DNA-directed RNA polymerase subunit RPC12/RpoP